MRKSFTIIAVLVLFAMVAAAQVEPRVETFLGYTYTRANSATNVPAFSMNGGSGQVGVNFNKWIGFVMDMGAVHNGNISDRHIDTTVSNYLFGPRISLRYSRVRPYFQTLFGGAHLGTSVASNLVLSNLPPTASQPIFIPGVGNLPIGPGQPVAGRIMTSQTAFGMAVGGGLDIKINRWVSFRPIGLDYYMTRFQNVRSLNDNNQHNIRYTTGFNFTFGGEKPAAAPVARVTTKPCPGGTTVPLEQECPKRDINLGLNVSQSSVCAGETVTVSPAAVLPSDTTTHWTINGEDAGQTASLQFPTKGRPAGTYRVGLKVSGEGYNDASTETGVTVRGYQPPTGTLQVSPPEIWAGEKATLVPDFRAGQCGGQFGRPAYTATEGSISGDQFDSTAVRFDPANKSEQRKTITVAAKVSDEGGSASAQSTVVVKQKATIMAKRLPDIIFPVGSARVNNCGKRVLLEQLKASTDNDPGGKVVFVGHSTENEAKWPGLDQKRALSAAAVISAGQGICTSFPANQIEVSAAGTAQNGVDPQPNFCGTSASERSGQRVNESDDTTKYRRVEVWFVPSGGEFPASVRDFKDAATLSVSSLGCPR